MASADRFILPYEGQWARIQPRLERLYGTLRRNPEAMVAAFAIGVAVVGVLIVVHAATSHANGAKTAPALVQPAKVAETTGSAPRVVTEQPAPKIAANCQDQTWPYIERACLTRPAGSARNVRVISTDNVPDKIDISPTSEIVAVGNAASPPPVVNERVRQDVRSQQEPPPPAQIEPQRSAESQSADAMPAAHDDARTGSVREYNVPSHDNPARRKRVIVRQADRHAVR